MPVIYERKEKVARITIDGRTEYNLLAPDTIYLPLYDALVQYRDDDVAWCLIVTAVGTTAFSAGGDLKAFEKKEEGYGREVKTLYQRKEVDRSLRSLMNGELKITKPIIFAVNGLCLGAAMFIMINYSDITVAASHAKFGLPELRWGVGEGTGGARLQRVLPWPIAMEMYLTGRLMDAEEAHRLGFINKMVPSEELMSVANAMAEDICLLPPLHVRLSKEVMLADRQNSLSFSHEMEGFVRGHFRDNPVVRAGIEEHKEALRAFVEKRKGNFKGKVE